MFSKSARSFFIPIPQVDLDTLLTEARKHGAPIDTISMQFPVRIRPPDVVCPLRTLADAGTGDTVKPTRSLCPAAEDRSCFPIFLRQAGLKTCTSDLRRMILFVRPWRLRDK